MQKYETIRMAKRSATECAGILDVCQRLELVNEERYAKGRELLISIVSMLVKWLKSTNRASARAGARNCGYARDLLQHSLVSSDCNAPNTTNPAAIVQKKVLSALIGTLRCSHQFNLLAFSMIQSLDPQKS